MKVQKYKVRNLVFKGGSAKGIAYYGCLTELEKVGVKLSKVKQVIGTSAGALTALFVSLNLYESPKKLKDCFDKDFTEFLDPGNPALKTGILEFAEASIFKKVLTATTALSEYYSSHHENNLGLIAGDEFRDWIDNVIFEETGIINCTFQELANLQRFKTLYVVATDLGGEGALIYSKYKTPNAIISDSIRSSTSIPFLFEPHKLYCKNEETGVREIPEGWEDHHLVDGAVVLNYPIKVFDEITNPALPDEILGFYLTSEEQIEKYTQKFPPKKRKLPKDKDNNNLWENELFGIDWSGGTSYSQAIYASYEHGQGAAHAIYEKEFDRTIYADNLKISSLKFGLSPEEKQQLIERGQKAVRAYFGEA
jgi:predicted acylesterase/phospholipase RssA